MMDQEQYEQALGMEDPRVDEVLLAASKLCNEENEKGDLAGEMYGGGPFLMAITNRLFIGLLRDGVTPGNLLTILDAAMMAGVIIERRRLALEELEGLA